MSATLSQVVRSVKWYFSLMKPFMDTSVSSRDFVHNINMPQKLPQMFIFSIFYITITAWNYVYVTGMLEDFGECTEVMIYPQSAILLQTAVVLASLIPGLTCRMAGHLADTEATQRY